jgi:hypothetical protein
MAFPLIWQMANLATGKLSLVVLGGGYLGLEFAQV